MAHTSDIKEHMEVIGADGAHVGTVDKVEANRLKLTKADSGVGNHKGRHHYVPTSLIAGVEGQKVRLSANGANVFLFEEEKDPGSARLVTKGRENSESRSARSEPGSSPSWSPLAIGAAAIAAVGGAAWFARSRQTESQRFALQLQNDEDIRLISSTKVEGTLVYSPTGERLGRIENFMVDKYTGRVAYAVLSFGGTFGIGEALLPLPWTLLSYDVKSDGYVLRLTKDQISRAPKFKASEAPEFSKQYRRDLAAAHERMM